MPQLTLTLLGGFAARSEGCLVTRFRSQKARALLAYLVMEAYRPHERAMLAALFWPEMPDALALRNLSQTLIWLRRAIGEGEPPFLLLNRRQVQWNAAAAVEVDALRFLALLECRPTPGVAVPDALREAVALYTGEFLAGFNLSGCPAFDEWLLLRREYFQHLALEALFRLTGEALAAGEYAAAATLARRQFALDCWQEEAIRQLLHALAAAGKYTEALAEYENARRLLASELEVAPQPETIQLAEAIRRRKVESRATPLLATPQTPAVEMLPRSVYDRDGDDLRMTLPVDLFTALLGGKVSVPAIDKSVNLTIPEGTRHGKTFRLTKLGMPKLRQPDERGDLYVTVAVELPSKLSDEEKRMVKEWKDLRK